MSIDSGIILRPGMVIDVADPLRGGTRRSGRVSSATTTVITVDSDTNLSVNLSNSPTLSVMMPTGLVETKTISSISGTAITVSSAFSEAPNANAVWLIQTSDIESQQFRVLNVAESGDGIYGVTALAYNESIYAAIESDIKLQQRDISNLTEKPDAVSNITGNEYLYQDGQSVFTAYDLSWQHNGLRTNEYRVQYRIDNDNIQAVTTTNKSITLKGLRAGTLKVQIQAYNYLNRPSDTASSDIPLVGKTAVPFDVSGLTLEPINANSARLKWAQATELDVKVGGKVHIRHSSLTDGSATWSNSVDLVNAVSGATDEVIVPLVEGEILVKFEDDGGRLSTNAVSVLVDLPDALGKLIIQQRREDADVPPFQGNKTDVFYNDEFDALTLDGDTDIDSITDFDLISSFDFAGDVLTSGEYEFVNTLDLGATFAVDLSRYFVTRGFFPNDLVDSRTGNVDTWSDWDGDTIDDVNAKLYLRSTTDDPAGTPTYGNWQEFKSGSYRGRGFQFKAELQSQDPAQNILIDELGYDATFQRRQEQSTSAVASGTSTKSVTFDKAFFTGTASIGGVNAYLPSVGITVQNLGAGERVNVSNVTGTGFDLDVLDSGGSNVDRNFTWQAVGYGKAV